MNNETAYLWKVNMDEELNDLKYYIDKIIIFVNELGNKEDFKIHKLFKHPKLALVGELDMISENKIVDIKFTNNISIKHILQLLFYNNIVDPKFDKEYELELWNFHLGNKYIIKINRNEIDKYKFLKLLSKSIGKKLENMIFLYDLETTGLLYANKKIDIIERHFEEYTTGIIASTGLIKPINVPFIPFEITKLTGITKELVFDKGDSMEIFKKEMSEIMEYCYNPIFIAHNGNSFDHKIMLDKNLLTYNNCKLLDSRIIIRLFLNDQISEKSLSDIFLFLFNFKPVIRRANSDVKMLLSIFEKLNISEDKILNM
jgi:DNA polymerase III epsilon subunit-like protein